MKSHLVGSDDIKQGQQLLAPGDVLEALNHSTGVGVLLEDLQNVLNIFLIFPAPDDVQQDCPLWGATKGLW